MMNKNEIKKIAKGILKFEKGIENPKLMHPSRDWQIGIITGIVVLTGAAVWNLDTYLSYRGESIIDEASTAADTVVYREALVMAALESYEALRNDKEIVLDEATLDTSEVIESPSSTSTDELPPIDEESLVEVATSTEVIAPPPPLDNLPPPPPRGASNFPPPPPGSTPPEDQPPAVVGDPGEFISE